MTISIPEGYRINPQGQDADPDRVLRKLRTLCPDAQLERAEDGTVTVGASDFCEGVECDPAEGEGESTLGHGCRCICCLIRSERTVHILETWEVNNEGGGRTVPVDKDAAFDGTGTDVTTTIEYQGRYVVTDPATGESVEDPDWIILGHELCGHALPMMEGRHPEFRPGRPGYRADFHEEAFEVEDAIREENDLPQLGVHTPRPKE